MCACNIQHHEVVIKKSSSNSIVVDKCIENEIKWLWSEGITTTGCCCGHNKGKEYIRVAKIDVAHMMFLGYKLRDHPYDHKYDRHCFYPQSV